MFQFGEVLGLAIAVMAAAYVMTNWQRILALPALKAFLVPFLLMLAAWIATVVEGIPAAGGGIPYIVFWLKSPQATAEGGAFSQIFNLVEHLCLAAAGVWLLLVLWRTRPSVYEKSP